MIINISTDRCNSSITNIDIDCIQPNAVDVRLSKVFAISSDDFYIDEQTKHHRTNTSITPINGVFNLDPGQYDIVFDHQVSIAEGECGWLIARSTLNRNGLFITSGLYDSGYNGIIGGVLHVNCGRACIKQGTRIAQFILSKAESVAMYSGDYGIGKEYDSKNYNT